MTLDLDRLRKIMPQLPAADAERYLPHLLAAMQEFEIDTPARAAAFLAQLAHESAELTRWAENLNYSAAGLRRTWPARFAGKAGWALALKLARQPADIANLVYASRMGNGPPESGDGWRFRGRGPIQLTGRDNYLRAGAALGLPLEDEPHLVAEPGVGFRAAGLYWTRWKGLNAIADTETDAAFAAITRKINGGTAGLAERRRYWKRAKEALAA